MPNPRPFLTAEWRHVLMLNYEVDPAVLAPLLPAGLELDLWEGHALMSVVGFRFLNTRVLGLPIPFHQNFEEVNLRFYVRPAGDPPAQRPASHQADTLPLAALESEPAQQDAADRQYPGDRQPPTDRRGVVFVKEIVPRPWIARVANTLYNEHYVSMPMGHTIERDKQGRLCPDGLVEYHWRCPRRLGYGKLNRLGGLALGSPRPLAPGSEEEFIAEHYWGYTRLGPKRTAAYPVAHPAWRVQAVAQPYLLCDVAALYGPSFAPYLLRRPRSAFLAEGSAISVGWKKSD